MADSTSRIATTGTRDYDDLASWWVAKRGETGVHTAELADEAHDGFTVNMAAQTATAFVVKPESGAEHNGKSHRDVTGSGAEVTRTGNRTFYLYQCGGADWTIEDICTSNDSNQPHVEIGGGPKNGETLIVQRCISTGGTGHYLTISSATGLTVDILDNIVYGPGRGIDVRNGADPASSRVHGNTVHCTGNYGILPTPNGTCSNNISVGAPSECYFGADTVETGNYSNIASDASADNEWNGGGGSHNNVEVLETGDTPTGDYVAFANLTPGSEDYSLVDLGHGTYVNLAIAGGQPGQGSGTSVNGEVRDTSTPDIGAYEMAAAGGGPITGTAAGTFGALFGAVAGTLSVSGDADGALPALQGSAVAAQTVSGVSAASLPAMEGAGAGAQQVSGDSAGVFPGLEGTGTGEQSLTATASGTLGVVFGTASGQVGANVSGSAHGVLPVLTGSASAELLASGLGTGTFPAIAGAGLGGLTVSGQSGPMLPVLQGSGSGTQSQTGTAAGLLPALYGGAYSEMFVPPSVFETPAERIYPVPYYDRVYFVEAHDRTYAVPAHARVFYIQLSDLEDGVMPHAFPAKSPGERLDYEFDFIKYGVLEVGETIASHIVTPSAGLTLVSSAADSAKQKITAWFSGGTADATYTAICRISTSKGRIAEAGATIPCKEKAP